MSAGQAILALDVGEARIGLARWDPEQGVREEGHLRRSSRAADLSRLSHIVAERDVGRVVVGLPLNADGSEGPQARLVRRFAAALARELSEKRAEGPHPQPFSPGEKGLKGTARELSGPTQPAGGVPVVLCDETETTLEATSELGLAGRPLTPGERRRVDARSAAILLRRYLASQASDEAREAG